MTKLRSIVNSFVVLALLVGLVVSAFNGISEGYQLTEQDLSPEGENVFERLKNINLLQGIEQLSTGIQELTNAKFSNPADLIGALTIGASGALQVIGGVVVFPLEITTAITGIYPNMIPPEVGTTLGFFVILAVGFILLKAKLGVGLED